jgi:hypothetical protein
MPVNSMRRILLYYRLLLVLLLLPIFRKEGRNVSVCPADLLIILLDEKLPGMLSLSQHFKERIPKPAVLG